MKKSQNTKKNTKTNIDETADKKETTTTNQPP